MGNDSMLKTIERSLLCFDVEWVPDPKAAEILHYVDLSEPGSELEAFETLWKEEGKADAENPRPYLKTILCRIVSIAGIVREDTGGDVSLRLFSMPADTDDPEKCSESRILSGFLRAVGEKRPQIVGFNSTNADLPIITQRAIRRGSFRKVKELIRRIERFTDHWNANTAPFAWTATADSILAKIKRLCEVIAATQH